MKITFTYYKVLKVLKLLLKNVAILKLLLSIKICLGLLVFLDMSLKTLPCMKTSLVSCKNQSFFLLFQSVVTFIKSHFVFLYYFLLYDEVLLSSLLDVSCFYGSSQWLFKVKQVALKSKIRFGSVCLL